MTLAILCQNLGSASAAKEVHAVYGTLKLVHVAKGESKTVKGRAKGDPCSWLAWCSDSVEL